MLLLGENAAKVLLMVIIPGNQLHDYKKIETERVHGNSST